MCLPTMISQTYSSLIEFPNHLGKICQKSPLTTVSEEKSVHYDNTILNVLSYSKAKGSLSAKTQQVLDG